MGDNLIFAVRGSSGFFLKRGLTTEATNLFQNNETPKENPCQVFEFSHNGRLFAYCDSQKTVVIDVASGKELLSTDLKRTKQIVFSPKDTHMATFEPYAIYGKKISADQKPEPNMRIFNLTEGKQVAILIAQKEATWHPQWTDDESIAVRLVGSELLIHKGNHFEKYDSKIVVPQIGGFALSPGQAPYSIACYTAANGSNPARVQVRRLNAEFSMVANKTFFKSDKAMLHWNHKGTALLILSSVEVDSSNQSYYGEQSVYMVNVQTDDSFMVPLAKKGPVYSAKWNPNGKEFAVCYGYMPAKVTFYNNRGEPTFDTLEGPRNDLYYNAFGNVLLICGFGNLAKGKMEFWDVEKKKEIISIDVPNTTQFEWAPDGQHFITATTTPRLRIDNCYRLWHYSGKLVSEFAYDSPKELWQVKFCPMLGYNRFEVKELSKAEKMQAGLLIKKKDSSHPLNNLPAGAVRQACAYIPPHLRKAGQTGLVVGQTPYPIKPQMNETEKKVFNLKKKIAEVSKLKERLAKGDVLQQNQLDKIENESKFIAELSQLNIGK